MFHPQRYLPPPVSEPPSVAVAPLMLIAPVVLIHGDRRRLHADEHNHAARLLLTLDKLGKSRVRLRAVIRGNTVLDGSSLRALNLYLDYGRGLSAFRRVIPWHAWRHRLAWDELQRLLSLRWVK